MKNMKNSLKEYNDKRQNDTSYVPTSTYVQKKLLTLFLRETYPERKCCYQ